MSVQLPASELAILPKTDHPPRLPDVREIEERAFAAAPGSTLIPLGEIHQRAAEIES